MNRPDVVAGYAVQMVKVRWQEYPPSSYQFQSNIFGRWQAFDPKFGWRDCEPPVQIVQDADQTRELIEGGAGA